MIKIERKSGAFIGAESHTAILIALAQSDAARVAALTAVMTGATGGSGSVVSPSAVVVGGPNSGSNLADKTTTEAALALTQSLLASLYQRANLLCTALGLPTKTYNGGGTANPALATQTLVVTGAATGGVVVTTNAVASAIDQAFYNLTLLVNSLCVAVGKAPVKYNGSKGVISSTIAALSLSVGTAASPGVLKSEQDAMLLNWANNGFVLRTALDGAVAVQTPQVLVV